jgi:hypothetical protein
MQYKDAVKVLLKRITIFAEIRASAESFISHDDDLPYIVYGEFGLFLLRHLTVRHERMGDEVLLEQSFELLSEMLTSSDPEIVNLALVGVMEILTDSPEAVIAAKKYLTDEAVMIFERWL